MHFLYLETLWPNKYLYDLLEHKSPCIAIGLKTPKELWSGKFADYSSLHIFGCSAYVHEHQHTKLDSKSNPCIFLGFEKGLKGQVVGPYCQEEGGRDVVFDEKSMLQKIQQ